MSLEDEINCKYDIDLCTKDGKAALIVCSVYDGMEKAKKLRDDLNKILEASSDTLYNAIVMRVEYHPDELATIKFVTTRDIEYEYKIMRYNDQIKIKPISESAELGMFLSKGTILYNMLKLMEKFLTTMNKNMDDAKRMVIYSKDSTFKDMMYEFVTSILRGNPSVRTFQVYIHRDEK